uniref:uncharacterized protein C15orf39 homolog n=1 Tax=Semicossyphus pulcher TaxID=241346 RepID=UPI0037E9383F
MMSSQSLVDPLCRRKMPLYDGTVASAGLSKPKIMSDFRGKQPLQYSGAYFTYDPRGKEAAGFTSPWSNSKTSPVIHLSGMEGQNHIIYRQDSNSSDEGHPHSSSLHHPAVKQGFTLCTKSPGMSSPTAATSVSGRKQKNGGENLSPPSENAVYLAIPKPVYGHNPCCNELGCVIGHRYSVERGSPRIPNSVYEHEWMQTDAHYTDRQPIQRKAQGLHFEPSAEPLKRPTVETYSPGRVRTFPAIIEPSYSSYPCTLPRTLFGPRLQTSPRGYPSFYPSHPTYEHMTSEVYQEHSPMSKYGHLTQHPMFYYPQANMEVENRTQCKDIGSKQREDVPVILKHTISNHREHYLVPQSLHGEIPLPLSDETLHNHSFMRGFDHPSYAVPRFHANASHVRELLNSHRINVSPTSHYTDHPLTSATNIHKDKPNPRHVDQSRTNSAFLIADQTSSPRRMSQPGISPSSVQANRFYSPLAGLHRPVLSPTALNMDRLTDYSSFEAQVAYQMQAKGFPVSPGAWVPRSSHHSSGQIHTVAPSSAKIINPPVAPGKKDNGPVSSSSPTVIKGCLKRSISHSSAPIKIKEESRELCEMELVKKRQKVKMEAIQDDSKTDSPPMPVIDNVFSLAPYQAYLQTPGLLFPGRVCQRTAQSSEHREEVKSKPDIKEKKACRDEQQPVVRRVSKEIRANTPTEKPDVEMFEVKNIKVEKVDPSDSNSPVETCSKVTVKKEAEDTGSPNREHMLVIKKIEPEELESEPSQTEKNDTSDESKPGEETAQIKTFPQDDASTLQEKVVALQPTSITPLQPPDHRLKFRNIPPQCLKLSQHKIVFHDPRLSSPVPPPEKPPVKLITQFVPNVELQTPVRKHFFDLHNSFCKLVSKSVLASSEQDLKTWLSQLELTELPSPSTKVLKVSCLLGIKARELWLNEEMKSALQQLLERLREYTTQGRCPFPHVMRTGAVFLPMLVVKELLFSTVQGGFIDQVLQEHKVELRPTTLSEEKILIQLHKRAFSSRLRRLMSLKHLPDIYADVVNLMYYTCVCKHLGLDTDDPASRQKDERCEEAISCRIPVFSDITASPASPAESHPERHLNDQETHFNRTKAKSRVKTSSRRLFLDSSLSDEDEADDTEAAVNGGVLHAFAEQEASFIPISTSSENSWTCPLTLEELSSSSSGTTPEEPSSPDTPYWGPAESPVTADNGSGVILKLRRMFSKGLNGKTACYQAISDSGTFADPSFSQADDGEGEVSGEMELPRRTPKMAHRWQRTGNFCHALRPLSSSSKRKHRSLLKIKYCPYLSACHSAEHRRRWVLRSAVQRARRTMRFYYPDLVGKKIRHLYEEDDKSEVWYRGEVLRIHEAHTNPLKTIFEVRYDSEPEWKYYLELLIDYKKGWLKIED